MKVAPTYLTFIFVLLSVSMYCQEHSLVTNKMPNDILSKPDTPQLKSTQSNLKKDSKFYSLPKSDINTMESVTTKVSTIDLNKTENQAKVIYAVSEVSTPRTTIDFF